MAGKTSIEDRLKLFARGKENILVETGIQNCVIYTRVSSKEQMDNNQSLEWQKKYCDEYAVKQKLNVLGYFGGTYESAKSDERKEFNRMLKYVKSSKQKISGILVYSLDRFSRTGDSAIYISSGLKKMGVNVVAVTQPIDTNSHSGALQQNIQFIFSKYDNDLRRQKTIDGMKEKLLRGEWLGQCPTGYEYVEKGVGKGQQIIINEKGELLKLAFEWKLKGIPNTEIAKKLNSMGLKITFQLLTDTFKNPFYCGYMANSLLKGEVVKGNHLPLISEDTFIKVNKMKDRGGYKQSKENDNLPLKSLIYDEDTKAPFTGYLVKKKNLYYYKVNKIGVGINRNISIMHNKFQELLAYYTISEQFVEPLITQLRYTWDNLTENNTGEKKALSAKLNEINKSLETLERRHAFGEVKLDIFEKYSSELYASKKVISVELEKLSQKLSNPNDLINYTVHTASKLPSVWACGNYYEKQNFQNMLFPEGLGYDTKIEHYRTPKINSVFGCVSDLAKVLEGKKEGDFSFLSEKSPLVAGDGFEPTTFGL